MTSALMMRRRAMKVAASGPLVSDAFNRADSTTLGNTDTGQPWTEHSGDWQIVGNRLKQVLTPDGGHWASVDSGAVNAIVRFDITFSSVRASAGVSSRLTDAMNNYFFRWISNDNLWEMYVRNSGTYTRLATLTETGLLGLTRTVELEVNGSTLIGRADGVQKISVTDSTFATQTRQGTLQGTSATEDDTATTWDNFKVTAT